MVTFEEIPTEVTLSLSISNCQGKCPGCHSPELRCNIGTELTNEKLDELITKNSGISCVLLLVEASPYDNIWGVKLSADNDDILYPEKWKGENLLGFALMQVRDNIK